MQYREVADEGELRGRLHLRQAAAVLRVHAFLAGGDYREGFRATERTVIINIMDNEEELQDRYLQMKEDYQDYEIIIFRVRHLVKLR